MDTLQSIIYNAIQSEYEAITIYTEASNFAKGIGNTQAQEVFAEIARDEMVHIGNLNKLLETFLPEDNQQFWEKFQEGLEEVQKELHLDKEVDSLNEEKRSEEAIPEVLKIYQKQMMEHTPDKADVVYGVDDEGYMYLEANNSSIDCPALLWNELSCIQEQAKHPVRVSYNKDRVSVTLLG